MFIVTAVETVGDISGVIEGGMDREATDKELSGGVICDAESVLLLQHYLGFWSKPFSQNVGTCDDDEDCKPNSLWHQEFSDPLRTVPKLVRSSPSCRRLCFRRRCSHDVLLDRCQRESS